MPKPSAHLGSVAVGSTIGPTRIRPTLRSLVMYSAAMWEFQRIHYDHEWARREGLEAPIVHGPLLGTYLAQLVRAWAGPGGQLRDLRWRNEGVAVVDRDLVAAGTVVDVSATPDGATTYVCSLRIDDPDGRRIVSGHATVRTASDERASGGKT